MPQCSVLGCTDRGHHKFPKDQLMRQKWIAAVRREQPSRGRGAWQPGSSASICSSHFDEDDYLSTNVFGDKPGKKCLNKSAVPHLQMGYEPRVLETPAAVARAKRAKTRCHKQLFQQGTSQKVATDTASAADDGEFSMELGREEVVDCETSRTEDCCDGSDQPTTSSNSTQTECRGTQLYSAKNFDDSTIHFYTGLETYSKFCMVLDSLGPAAYQLNYYHDIKPQLSIEDQFLLTLIKLRTHPTNQELSIFFGATITQVSNIFITWINFMYSQWSEVNWWPTKDMVRYFAPSDFRLKFPNTRLIIDGTEFPIVKPKNPLLQQATFSTYKNRNTMKVVVGASPGGLISYISPAYGGATSDRQITERSSLPTMCDPGDDVMADKGFNVDDLFLPYQVRLNMPTFFSRKNRMSGKTVKKDRAIASKRVHIERLIGLGKTYKILRDPMNHTEYKLATQISSVVFWLCNFRKRIISVNA